MGVAYVDASALLAMAFNESAGVTIAQRLNDYEQLVSSNLLEAEARAAFAREGKDFHARFIPRIEWILPERELSEELGRVFSAGYARGADAWHLAAALYAALELEVAAFITLDTQQRRVAEALGFDI